MCRLIFFVAIAVAVQALSGARGDSAVSGSLKSFEKTAPETNSSADTDPRFHAPLIDHPDERYKDFVSKIEGNNPLTHPTTSFAEYSIYILAGLGGLSVLGMVAIFFLTRGEPEDEYDLELPEDVYGETYATLVVSLHKWSTNGVSLGLFCEFINSIFHLLLQWAGVFMLVLSVNNTLASLDADTDERDSISTKFRDPVYWQAQNWNLYPESEWRRDSMVWFCHDMITGPKGMHGYKGKASHVNQLSPMFFMFQWVVLLVWLAHILIELRASWHFKHLIIDLPTVNSLGAMIGDGRQGGDDDGEDRDTEATEGEMKVQGLTVVMKIILMAFIFLPQLYITGILCYTGMTFLLNNDLEDDLQGMLLNTIGLVFVLELDTLIYDAFTSQQKKQQLSSLSFPSFLDKGMMRVLTKYGDVPRLCILIIVTTLVVWNMALKVSDILTPREAGIVEGCCNFMQYLKGAGVKVPLADANPCTIFRKTYESSLGIDETGGLIAPGDHPEHHGITAGNILLQMQLRRNNELF